MIRKRKRTVQYQVFQPNGRKKTITVKVGGTKTESTSPCSTLSPPACKIPEPSVPIAENKNKKSRDYNETKQSRITEWTRVMPLLTKAQLESFCPTTNDCSVCHQQLTEKFRCIDCMRDPVCLSCLQAAHGRPHLHIFEGWKNGTYLGYDCETPTWKRESHECNSLYSKTLAVVDSLGRQHKRTILFCRCEPEAVTLVRHQLWPSSPKNPTIAFDFELMKWFYGLLLEGHLSLRSFVTALSTPQSKHEVGYTKKEILNVYKVMVTETTEQFRYFWYQQQYGDVGQIKLDNGTECPACFKMDTKVFSMDADFQLVRKNSSGKSWEQPKHSGQFFLEQESVDSFISSLQSTAAEKNAQPVHDCHEFQAGNALRSKVKNSKLSETAVFGSVCRHEFPHAFFSLRHGERLGYPIFLLQHILQTHPVHTKIHVTYDIACVLEKHLKVMYNPRKTIGLGLSDGEGIERLWSYLGGFSKITKEMTPENRIDLLVDGLVNYGKKIKENLGEMFLRKDARAKQILEQSEDLLNQILNPFPEVTTDRVKEWYEEERQQHQTVRDKDAGYTWQEDYVMFRSELSNLKFECALQSTTNVDLEIKYTKEINRLEKKITLIEKKYGVHWSPDDQAFKDHLSSAKNKKEMLLINIMKKIMNERTYLLQLVKKYAKGQSIAKKLNKQLSQATKELQKRIKEYNSISCRDTVTLKDLPALCKETHSSNNGEMDALKAEAVSLYCLIERAKEERCLVLSECNAAINWNMSFHSSIDESVNAALEPLRAFLIKEAIFYEYAIKHLHAVRAFLTGDSLEMDFDFKYSSDLSDAFNVDDLLQEINNDDMELEEVDSDFEELEDDLD